MASEFAPVVERADVGGTKWSEKRTIEWRIHDFEELPHENGDYAECPVLKCHGFSWQLRVYPRGDDEDCSESVSVYVAPVSDLPRHDVWMLGKIVVRGNDYDVTRKFRRAEKLMGGVLHGDDRFFRRDDLSDFLVDGALVVQVELRVSVKMPQPWKPKKSIGSDMGKLLKSKKLADISFVVDRVSFPAHRSVLAFRAPTLFEMSETSAPSSDVPLEGVSASAFSALLHFIYTDEILSTETLQKDARELLDAADRFGCKGLKLLAESELLKSGITAENVGSLLLLADAKSCALLREAAVGFIASNPTAAMASEDWAHVKESKELLAEIMEAAFGAKNLTSQDGDEPEYDKMDVTSLRRKLDDAGLSGDGTREMLVKRLKAHHHDQT